MPKLGIFSGQDICQLLSMHGFVLVRQKGSHAIMQLRVSDTTITVPIPLHREIKIGTLLSIIRQSQLPRAYFEK
ncbi:MAG: type II toxin-antitoxin system HicA family toxin [Kiritimatiellaeota bacterium]|nr:type II toxin-antitoxin system HicA family toxin [Kiritimatiellota bacterium]